jgi:hypothetical protein
VLLLSPAFESWLPDNYLAVASSFSLLMVFVSSILYKLAALTSIEDLQDKMSIEQQADYIVDNVLLSSIMMVSILAELDRRAPGS